jgi:hypothetical protein
MNDSHFRYTPKNVNSKKDNGKNGYFHKNSTGKGKALYS